MLLSFLLLSSNSEPHTHTRTLDVVGCTHRRRRGRARRRRDSTVASSGHLFTRSRLLAPGYSLQATLTRLPALGYSHQATRTRLLAPGDSLQATRTRRLARGDSHQATPPGYSQQATRNRLLQQQLAASNSVILLSLRSASTWRLRLDRHRLVNVKHTYVKMIPPIQRPSQKTRK